MDGMDLLRGAIVEGRFWILDRGLRIVMRLGTSQLAPSILAEKEPG